MPDQRIVLDDRPGEGNGASPEVDAGGQIGPPMDHADPQDPVGEPARDRGAHGIGPDGDDGEFDPGPSDALFRDVSLHRDPLELHPQCSLSLSSSPTN